MGQGAAIIFATLFKCDIGQAQGAASNAIENNFIFALMPIITSLSDYMLHKMYHGILGAGRGAALAALRGEDVGSAALGGSIGGIVAEVVAEGMRGSIDDRINARIAKGETDRGKIHSEELARLSSIGQGAAIIFATLFRCDITYAQGAASNAIENNAAQLLWGAVAGSMAVWSACDIYDTYRTEGPEAALIQAGTEVVVTAAGVKAFKIAGRVFYTAEAAWGAYLIENPRMAAIAEYCVEQGGKAKGFAFEQGAKLADYVKSTGAGKFVSSINAKVEAKFAQWFGSKEAIDAGVGVRGAMEQATDLRNHMSFEDKHSFVFYSLRYLPFLK